MHVYYFDNQYGGKKVLSLTFTPNYISSISYTFSAESAMSQLLYVLGSSSMVSFRMYLCNRDLLPDLPPLTTLTDLCVPHVVSLSSLVRLLNTLNCSQPALRCLKLNYVYSGKSTADLTGLLSALAGTEPTALGHVSLRFKYSVRDMQNILSRVFRVLPSVQRLHIGLFFYLI